MKNIVPFILISCVLVGCSIPIPSSIGLRLTDEIVIDIDSLASLTVMAEKCRANDYAAPDETVREFIDSALNKQQMQSYQDKRQALKARKDAMPSGRQLKPACKQLIKNINLLNSKKLILDGGQ